MNTTLLDYLRHGLPKGGSHYRGHGIDDPLSKAGWAQMHATTAVLGGWQAVISSPLVRCATFAQWLTETHDLPLHIDEDLREVGFGNWEGRTRAELIAECPDEYHAFYADPVHNRPVGAEPLEAFGTRVAAAFQHIVARHAGQRVLVVAHAGVIRATLGHVLAAPPDSWYRAAVDNAAISRFAHDGESARLVWHNWRPPEASS